MLTSAINLRLWYWPDPCQAAGGSSGSFKACHPQETLPHPALGLPLRGDLRTVSQRANTHAQLRPGVTGTGCAGARGPVAVHGETSPKPLTPSRLSAVSPSHCLGPQQGWGGGCGAGGCCWDLCQSHSWLCASKPGHGFVKTNTCIQGDLPPSPHEPLKPLGLSLENIMR